MAKGQTMSTMAVGSNTPESGAAYRDKKRYLWPLSLVWPLVPVIGVYLANTTGLSIFYWLIIIIWYGVIPILDFLLGLDSNNPPESAISRLEADRYYRYLTYATVPVHYITLLFCAWVVGTQDLGWVGYLGLAFSVGLANGLGINTGHELGHKKTKLERWLARIVLAIVGYGHFYIEHNKGHHKDVATPEDPASSRFGENIYKFVLRETPGAWRRAWASEATRLARKGKSPWSWENEVLQPLAITIPMYGTLIYAFGPVVILFLFIQAAYGWWQLTSANYIEHYGLLRRTLEDGRYERCQPEHSWNSNHIMSNLILFHLQRHSDHHAHPTRRYQALRDFPDLPSLPSGYPAMFAVALFPPLWRWIMDRRVLKLHGGDVTKMNLDPDKREKIMRRYGQVAQAGAAE